MMKTMTKKMMIMRTSREEADIEAQAGAIMTMKAEAVMETGIQETIMKKRKAMMRIMKTKMMMKTIGGEAEATGNQDVVPGEDLAL
jgi:hypothetical protein